MKIEEIKTIRINKNRGWRGLAELVCEDECGIMVHKVIFSFSSDVWNDLLEGYIVIQDEDNYYVLQFDNTDKLPHPPHQRTVLIKSFVAHVLNIATWPKSEEVNPMTGDYDRVYHFMMNRNNHTTSDWNCIGIRVRPDI